MQQNSDKTYSELSRDAIGDEDLHAAIRMVQNGMGKGAQAMWRDEITPEHRRLAKEARLRTLNNLDAVLATLAEKIRARGGHVYFAATAEDARNYCLEVARKNNVRLAVKGKSMTSAEIGMDPLLEENGVEVVETDLGEYIIQLAGEAPSHIIAPCIHMNRKRIGKLFQEKLGIPYSEDPPTLTRAARKALREKLLGADMGISGCNIACAETGHVCLVSNEGNIRMCTTMPKVHVALMGMERVTATLAEHDMLLRLLTRGASAQKVSTYVSFMGGPRQPGETDGPEEFHLVIIDNGRMKMLADPRFREVLSCIRCGGCLNICPVYGRIGGHAYNGTYCGPIGAVLMPLLEGVNKHADLCRGESLCGACKDICPVHNDLPRMLSELRYMLAYGDEKWGVEPVDGAEACAFKAWGAAMSSRTAYDLLVKAGRIVQVPFVKNGVLGKGVGPLAKWTASRDFPPIAKKTFAERWKTDHAKRLNGADNE
ncbi:LutB/LldF family L-lactate oxidation iron-sulfur protein [Pseudodesulfovibrio thermohalotolerans]|uniref:LutB/LldF family L-lactate oxidation iron-sulfur protein n=1 Tax=Pseudodesulfovibrio thermohalotolerans TaxID=2880651 RepID=UPI002442BB7C|nr:LutB/LldF family L-lactate oxidation iron-sulfur protein [Pseudodesulfovibrio thermohalotolerans]WFS62340.1 LutB/LldF family L-lactate oxidation iron-sulfur protein [Pseudodesulfovibrio thermohalotolerans]